MYTIKMNSLKIEESTFFLLIFQWDSFSDSHNGGDKVLVFLMSESLVWNTLFFYVARIYHPLI